MIFSNILISWYLQNKRDLPWRNTQNPYLIWLSEIMLQQTRVKQGLPYFLKFTEAFPTVYDLANATEEQVLKLWQGLGYYSRARNLHSTAKHIAYGLNGIFPDTYQKLLSLKGVGEYTAAAIASFSFLEPVPVVDGNVFRVLARVFDIKSDISNNGTKKEFQLLSGSLMPKNDPAIYNQAIMEFGALQCVPKNPDCASCIMNEICLANKNNSVKILPVKSKKTKVRDRYFNYAVIKDKDNNILYQQRKDKDIWQHLYEFPLIETVSEIDTETFIDLLSKKENLNNKIIKITENPAKNTIHKLTHQRLNIKFRIVEVEGILPNSINTNDFARLPLPVAINYFISNDSF